MKNLSQIKDRYLREPFNKRLGHLASDLARISTFLENSINARVIGDILEESKFFIEWTAPEAPPDVQELFSEMQSKLALWQYHLLQQKETSLEIEKLRKAAKRWSEHLLKISGLVDTINNILS